VSAIALLCLVLLCTPVQLDCSLAAPQAGLLFTPVSACYVHPLATQIIFAASMPTSRIHSSRIHSWASFSFILLTISSSFMILLIDGRLELSSDRTTCGIIAVLIFVMAYPPLRSSCSSWDQTIIYCARLCVLSCGIIAA
jgi:hypothetical protein